MTMACFKSRFYWHPATHRLFIKIRPPFTFCVQFNKLNSAFMSEWFILIYLFISLILIMKNPKTTIKKADKSVKSTSKAKKTEKSVKEMATEATPKKPAESVKKSIPKKASPKKKVSKKDKAVTSSSVVATQELTISDRIGSTAGSIWHYLSKNGTCSAASLFREINEDEKIIQRSIGWLAQEGKIILNTTGRSEMISLK